MMRVITQNVTQILCSAYKPKTWETYKAMFVIYMAFCEFTSSNFAYPSEITVITFIKFLCFNGLLLFKDLCRRHVD